MKRKKERKKEKKEKKEKKRQQTLNRGGRLGGRDYASLPRLVSCMRLDGRERRKEEVGRGKGWRHTSG